MTATRFRPLANMAALPLTQSALAAAPIIEDNPAQRTVEDFRPSATSAGQWTVGLGAAYVPRYEGSKEHVLRALPVVAYQRGRFAAGVGGLSYNLSSNSALEFGPLLSYSGGRDPDDADRLRGPGDIDGGFDVGAFARWRLSAWSLRANVKRGIGSGPEGTQVQLGVSHLSSFGQADRLLLGASVDWADNKYTQAYIGVNASQSAASGLPACSASAGVKSYGVNAVWIHTFTPAWFSTIGVHAKRLSGDAADSPITEQRNLLGASASIGYRV